MNAPFFWLDMTVVICVVAAAIFGSLLFGREPSLQRGKLRFLSIALLGMAFLLGGTDSLLTLRYAPRSTSIGAITHLTNHGGKNSKCDVTIRDGKQTLSIFSGDFSCYGLRTGDQVRLQWMEFNDRIAHLDIIAGPDAGSFRRGGDPFTSAMAIGLGLYFLYGAGRSRRLNPTGSPPKKDTQGPAQGDVDEQSLLNLNNR